jgi:hypothetical protein
MFCRFILLMIAACALAMPAAAQAPAPTTTAFDGRYLGVSNTFEEELIQGGRTWARWCRQFGPPPTLTIFLVIAASGVAMPVAAQAPAPTTTAFDGKYVCSATPARGHLLCGAIISEEMTITLPRADDAVGRRLHGGIEETSKTASGPEKCPPSGVAATLMIRNSIVLGYWQGAVSPQGVLTMPNGSMRFNGQIDSQGTVRGKAANDAGCVRAYVWRKESA